MNWNTGRNLSLQWFSYQASIEVFGAELPQRFVTEIFADSLDDLEPTNSKKKVKVLLKRLIKNKLPPVYTKGKVPPDNNASDRAIRNMKVKTKVPDLFRSKNGADIYATPRLIVDTTNKQKKSPFMVLANPNTIMGTSNITVYGLTVSAMASTQRLF